MRLATARVTPKGRPSSSRSTTTWSTGMPGGVGDALDQVAPQPARGRGREGRDEHLVGVVLGDRVHRGGVGVGVADLADGVDALLAQDLAREVDAHLGGVEDGVVVDHVAVARVRARDADDHAQLLAGGLLLDALQQRLAAERLVRDDQDGLGHGLLLSRRLGRGWSRRGRTIAHLGLGGGAEDAVHRAGDAVLVRAADDRRDGVEVEDRRRRGDLPLERERAPRVRRPRAGRRATRRSCCRRRPACSGRARTTQIEMNRFQFANLSA